MIEVTKMNEDLLKSVFHMTFKQQIIYI